MLMGGSPGGLVGFRESFREALSDDDVVRYYREHSEEFMRDGQLRPFDEVREAARTRAVESQRAASARQWVEGLRRRGSVQLLYLPAAGVNK